MILKKSWFILWLCWIALPLTAQVKGRIIDDSTLEPIPFAHIYWVNEDEQTIADEKGIFIKEKLPDNGFAIVSHLGYRPDTFYWNSGQKELTIYLKANIQLLSTLLIAEDHAKNESYYATFHLSESFFKNQTSSTFAEILDQKAGIQSITTGTGIAKPVIRGLHGNRITINKDYIKQEGHQWGIDHGVEITPFEVERVEILKGPSSLMYGSDAMGGVINVLPDALPHSNTTTLDYRSVFKSNQRLWGQSLRIKSALKNYFGSARISIQQFGDFTVPANEFEYAGTRLPLASNRAKNTAGMEKTLHLMLGWRHKGQILRASYSVYNLLSGLFSGAIGIPRTYQLTDDGDRFNIDLPRQSVTHQRATINYLNNYSKGHWAVNLGFQKNKRAEYSFAEAHSALEGWEGKAAALQFDLRTFQCDVHLDYNPSIQGRLIIGNNTMHQMNTRDGFDFLFPNFMLWRSGIFGMYEYKKNKQTHFSAGLRYDIANTLIDSFAIRRLDRQGFLISNTLLSPYERRVSNFAASVGVVHMFNENAILRGHLGRSFRVPYPNELSSNGRHHGFFRHEAGNQNLSSEIGYQADVSSSFQWKNFRSELAVFTNYFDGYIYLRPTPRFSALPEGGLLFEFTQHNAIFTGFEAEYAWQFHPSISWTQAMEFVHTYNTETGLALPFTPPFQSTQSIKYQYTGKSYKLECTLSHLYTGANGLGRTDRNEKSTPSYHLWIADVNMSFKRFEGATLQLSIRNILNTPYLNHLSRYRIIELPEPGRNFIISLYLPLKWVHSKQK